MNNYVLYIYNIYNLYYNYNIIVHDIDTIHPLVLSTLLSELPNRRSYFLLYCFSGRLSHLYSPNLCLTTIEPNRVFSFMLRTIVYIYFCNLSMYVYYLLKIVVFGFSVSYLRPIKTSRYDNNDAFNNIPISYTKHFGKNQTISKLSNIYLIKNVYYFPNGKGGQSPRSALLEGLPVLDVSCAADRQSPVPIYVNRKKHRTVLFNCCCCCSTNLL